MTTVEMGAEVKFRRRLDPPTRRFHRGRVAEIREDGTLIVLEGHRSARGGLWVTQKPLFVRMNCDE